LDVNDEVECLVKSIGQLLVDGHRFVSSDEEGSVAISLQQAEELVVSDPGQDSGVCDLVAFKWRIGKTAPSPTGSKNLLERQLAANGPVSASPSPMTQATINSGLSSAAPYA
jgi:hypothetical protein